MQPDEARLLREVVESYCGLRVGLDAPFFLERRVGPRLEALGMTSYRDYYHFLKYDPAGEAELVELVERLTTHETYFFRELYQLEAFRDDVLPELVERARRRKRILLWSAGCSTGEEVYTLAMILKEEPSLADFRVRVIGSDISRKVVARARQAYFGPSSFRAMDETYRKRYFQEVKGRFRLRDDVRSMCSFGQLNLMDTERFRVLGTCDAIFCRNVLMYLSPTARNRIVDGFYDALHPGGYLFLGHSESLLHVHTRFEIVQLEKDLVYRKPIEGSER
ncbi:MAG: methyltransferase domain-containing protein [Deltaproteobacteria bacterium]|nr:MAG: methyltransferase domain-containing protein [Deltaproteobacteria bacterium]